MRYQDRDDFDRSTELVANAPASHIGDRPTLPRSFTSICLAANGNIADRFAAVQHSRHGIARSGGVVRASPANMPIVPSFFSIAIFKLLSSDEEVTCEKDTRILHWENYKKGTANSRWRGDKPRSTALDHSHMP